jgi:hypothetical protein
MIRWTTLILATALGALSCTTTPVVPEQRISTAPIALKIHRVDGQEITLGSLRGRVVLVTVMTTWADLALLEVPRLKKLATSVSPKDLVVAAIALDDNVKMVRMFAQTFQIPYYIGTIDDPATFTGEDGPFGKITLLPTSVLLDRDGRIAARMEGLWPPGVLEEAVRRLVATAPGSH